MVPNGHAGGEVLAVAAAAPAGQVWCWSEAARPSQSKPALPVQRLRRSGHRRCPRRRRLRLRPLEMLPGDFRLVLPSSRVLPRLRQLLRLPSPPQLRLSRSLRLLPGTLLLRLLQLLLQLLPLLRRTLFGLLKFLLRTQRTLGLLLLRDEQLPLGMLCPLQLLRRTLFQYLELQLQILRPLHVLRRKPLRLLQLLLVLLLAARSACSARAARSAARCLAS